MTLDTPKEIELKARIDEIDCAIFLLNSGVSDSAVRSGFLERRREWVKQLTGAPVLSKEASERLLSDMLEDESREEKLREVLQGIADIAVGHGDVCELIARRARAVLAQGGHAEH
jgi:hypothetical protein